MLYGIYFTAHAVIICMPIGIGYTCIKNWKLIPNVRSWSSQTFPFMGMFDWEEGLIPLAQSHRDNAPNIIYLCVFLLLSIYDHNDYEVLRWASPRICRQYRQSEDEQLWPMAMLTFHVLSTDPRRCYRAGQRLFTDFSTQKVWDAMQTCNSHYTSGETLVNDWNLQIGPNKWRRWAR